MKLRESVLYFHINLIKQEIFYIGIGNKHRPYSQGSRNNFWKNEVKKYGYHVVVIHESLTWKEACELEKQYIKQIGRRDLSLGTLVNLTDGGEGLEPGTDKTKEIRELGRQSRIRYAKERGYWHSEKTKEKIAQTLTGRSSPNKGKTYTGTERSLEFGKKMSNIKIQKLGLQDWTNIKSSKTLKVGSRLVFKNNLNSDLIVNKTIKVPGQFQRNATRYILSNELSYSYKELYKLCYIERDKSSL